MKRKMILLAMGVWMAGVLGVMLSIASVGSAGRTCTSEEMKKEHLQKLAYASNSLGLKLHQRMSYGSSRNIVFSPFSLSCLFGMMLYGARSKTAEQLRDVLRYSSLEIPDDLVHHTFHRFLTEVFASSNKSAPYFLHAANAVFFDRTLDVIPEYRTEVQRLYKAVVKDVDFRNDVQEAVKEINGWVRDRTRGKIKKLADDLSPETTMVMMNAVYFKGTWKTQFDKSRTYEDTFYNMGSPADAVKVPMMHSKGRFRYASSDDCQVVELPYKGNSLSMVIVLPNKPKGLFKLEQSLTLHMLMELYDLLYDTKVVLSLPKFKVRFGADMTHLYSDLGAGDLFVPGAADLSGMTPDRNQTLINHLMHKAAIEVNEEGSEAAAFSSIVTTRMGDETIPVIRADHPFMFFIIEQGSEMILFMGRVTKL